MFDMRRMALGLMTIAMCATPILAVADEVLRRPPAALGALNGLALADSALGHARAKGVTINGAFAGGQVSGNVIGNHSLTGNIANTNAITGNSGITTVFQNTGNNSLFQSSTSIFISVH